MAIPTRPESAKFDPRAPRASAPGSIAILLKNCLPHLASYKKRPTLPPMEKSAFAPRAR